MAKLRSVIKRMRIVRRLPRTASIATREHVAVLQQASPFRPPIFGIVVLLST